ncbi:MAG: DUF192 domain-containing protein [Patescibacteria group bacterium]
MQDAKKFLIPLASATLFVIIGSVLGYSLTKKSPKSSIETVTSPLFPKKAKKLITVGETKVFIEIADDPKEWQIGLSEHKSLGASEGMLFIFDRKDTMPSFWMEGMDFDIDIIWINDGKVTQVEQNVPKPNLDTPSSELPLYQPYDVIDYVLEVNAGYVKEEGIAVGDNVDFSQLEENN